MKNRAAVSMKYISAQIFLLLCALFLVCGSPAYGAATAQRQPIVREPVFNAELFKILPVLEDKIGDRKLLEKSKEKIYGMDSREVRLIAALCEKVSDEQTVSSDIAFLLVTALIVLS